MLFWTPLVSIPFLQVTCHTRQPWQTSIKFSEKHQVNFSEYMWHREDCIVLLAQTMACDTRTSLWQNFPVVDAILTKLFPGPGGVRELIRKVALVCCHWNLLSYPQQPQRSASAEGSFVVVVSNSLLQNISWLHPRAEALSAHPPRQTHSSCRGLSRLPVHWVYKLTPYRGCTRAD